MNGKIKWYNRTRGFGFIESEKGKDIFVHRTGLDDPYMELPDGQEVIFETKEGAKGLSASQVKLA
jgi:CspA family cold shock protein